MHYEIKIKENGRSWEETPAMPKHFKSFRGAVYFCKFLAEQMQKDIRLERDGICQGHFARPALLMPS